MFYLKPVIVVLPDGKEVDHGHDNIYHKSFDGVVTLVGSVGREKDNHISLICETLSEAEIDEIQEAVIAVHGGEERVARLPHPWPAGIDVDDELNI